jgi:putative membrane protein
MKTSLLFSSLVALGALVTFGTQALAADAAVDGTDKSFIQNAYESGLAEVKFSEMAQAKTGNADVKAFATMLATDHAKANGELKTLADSKKVEVATDITMMAKAKAKLLDAKSGADFDKAFMEGMVKGHKDSVDNFQKAANEAKDADVKAFAAKTLPTLKAHLAKAEEISKKVGN